MVLKGGFRTLLLMVFALAFAPDAAALTRPRLPFCNEPDISVKLRGPGESFETYLVDFAAYFHFTRSEVEWIATEPILVSWFLNDAGHFDRHAVTYCRYARALERRGALFDRTTELLGFAGGVAAFLGSLPGFILSAGPETIELAYDAIDAERRIAFLKNIDKSNAEIADAVEELVRLRDGALTKLAAFTGWQAVGYVAGKFLFRKGSLKQERLEFTARPGQEGASDMRRALEAAFRNPRRSIDPATRIRPAYVPVKNSDWQEPLRRTALLEAAPNRMNMLRASLKHQSEIGRAGPYMITTGQKTQVSDSFRRFSTRGHTHIGLEYPAKSHGPDNLWASLGPSGDDVKLLRRYPGQSEYIHAITPGGHATTIGYRPAPSGRATLFYKLPGASPFRITAPRRDLPVLYDEVWKFLKERKL